MQISALQACLGDGDNSTVTRTAETTTNEMLETAADKDETMMMARKQSGSNWETAGAVEEESVRRLVCERIKQ